MEKSVILESEERVVELAGRMLDHLRPSDVVLLEGPVGVGKSALARGVIQAQMLRDGYIEDVPSPTFTLVQTYDTSIGEIWHADLYRLTSLGEIAELGLSDAFHTTICFVEWPVKLGEMTPKRHLKITLSTPNDNDCRLAQMTGVGDGWEWIDALD